MHGEGSDVHIISSVNMVLQPAVAREGSLSIEMHPPSSPMIDTPRVGPPVRSSDYPWSLVNLCLQRIQKVETKIEEGGGFLFVLCINTM